MEGTSSRVVGDRSCDCVCVYDKDQILNYTGVSLNRFLQWQSRQRSSGPLFKTPFLMSIPYSRRKSKVIGTEFWKVKSTIVKNQHQREGLQALCNMSQIVIHTLWARKFRVIVCAGVSPLCRLENASWNSTCWNNLWQLCSHSQLGCYVNSSETFEAIRWLTESYMFPIHKWALCNASKMFEGTTLFTGLCAPLQ